jgi:hypothetical protein
MNGAASGGRTLQVFGIVKEPALQEAADQSQNLGSPLKAQDEVEESGKDRHFRTRSKTSLQKVIMCARTTAVDGEWKNGRSTCVRVQSRVISWIAIETELPTSSQLSPAELIGIVTGSGIVPAFLASGIAFEFRARPEKPSESVSETPMTLQLAMSRPTHAGYAAR